VFETAAPIQSPAKCEVRNFEVGCISCTIKATILKPFIFLQHNVIVVFLALQPIVVVFSQPGSRL
jgi:hypothetical protein